jgi:peptide chain release factor 1
VTGKGAKSLFQHEAGGHRFQGESGGRTHSSTITVAVLREPTPVELHLDERDLEFKTCRGSGAGGQSRNTTDSAVILTHLPTKLSVRIESERSQLQNKETARAVLRARLLEAKEAASAGAYSAVRKGQVGTGMRGDKRRTVQEQNGIVVDHVRNRRTDVKSYMKGDLDWLM